MISHFQTQGERLPDFQVSTLNHGLFDSHQKKGPLIIVFWATWCGPCGIELKRIQNLINWGKLDPNEVLAISSFEEEALLRKTVQEKSYTFPIGIDLEGHVGKLFHVESTPTILFSNSQSQVSWFSSGLSPLLELRILLR